jgi:hypothetical protein
VSLASLAELKQFGGITSDDRDVDLERALDAATEHIHQHCGRTFVKDAADVTKLFYPTVEGMIDVVDLISVTTVKVDSRGDRSYATTLATTEYELLPYNGERYEQIRVWPTSSKTMGPGRLVQVVGRFGYVDELGRPPADVVQACLMLANRYRNRPSNPFGILQSPDLGQYTRISKMDPDVETLLEPYRLAGTSWVMI